MRNSLYVSVAALMLAACQPSHAQQETVDYSIVLECDELVGLEHQEITTTIEQYKKGVQMMNLFGALAGVSQNGQNTQDAKADQARANANIDEAIKEFGAKFGVQEYDDAVFAFVHGVQEAGNVRIIEVSPVSITFVWRDPSTGYENKGVIDRSTGQGEATEYDKDGKPSSKNLLQCHPREQKF
jgi:hypothetical protein